MFDWKLDLPELSEQDSDLIRQTRDRHAKQDAFDVDKFLAQVAEMEAARQEKQKAQGKHE